ncbi:hypothetical protein OKW46_004424 [Paraburkholderia sp. WSM4179]|nr:hypothetical protein [Paraburkholderia sp. WSM4179]
MLAATVGGATADAGAEATGIGGAGGKQARQQQ